MYNNSRKNIFHSFGPNITLVKKKSYKIIRERYDRSVSIQTSVFWNKKKPSLGKKLIKKGNNPWTILMS